jgi:hypothetical protein
VPSHLNFFERFIQFFLEKCGQERREVVQYCSAFGGVDRPGRRWERSGDDQKEVLGGMDKGGVGGSCLNSSKVRDAVKAGHLGHKEG